MLHYLRGSTLRNDIQHIAGLPFALVGLHSDLLLCGGFGAEDVGLQLVVGQAQLVHDQLSRLFRGTTEQLFPGQLQLLQQPLVLQRQAGYDLSLFLFTGKGLLIFRTGNGHHFFRVACLNFSVFHEKIIPQSSKKSQRFQ